MASILESKLEAKEGNVEEESLKKCIGLYFV